MSSFFDSQLWDNLILPMSHSERAVTHAVVAISALHEDMEARGMPLARAELKNRRQRFALEQYTRALSLLNTRRYSNDPKLRDVVLTCCLLFVVFELVRGLYDGAFVHLQQGLSLLSSLKAVDTTSQESPVSSGSTHIETSLSDALMHLHIESAFFGVDIPNPQLNRLKSQQDNEDFRDITEAREELDKVFRPVSRFMTTVGELLSEGGPPDSHVTRVDVARMQTNFRIELARYLHRLTKFESRVYHSLDHKTQRAIDLIRLHHKTFSVALETYIDLEGMTYDFYVNDFKEMVILSEKITKSFDEEREPNKNNSRSRPTLLLDMGIIPPLLYVCLKCPCVETRRQAMRCLRAWPHREGPWDSNLIGLMGRLILQVEIEQEFKRLSTTTSTAEVTSIRDITYITPPSRIMCANMTMDDDQKTAILRYNTKECVPGMPQLEKRVLVDG